MEYYWLNSEPSGELGDGNDYDVSRTPSLIGTLHFEFADWAGDDIVEAAGFWLVTDRVAHALQASGLSGWQLADVILTFGDYWKSPAHGEFPRWKRLIPVGKARDDDFGLKHTTRLVISERALAFLKQFTLKEADLYSVTEFPDGPPPSDVMADFMRWMEQNEQS